MILDVVVCVLAVGVPLLALGALLAPWCGDEPATAALGPVAAYGLLVLVLRLATNLGLPAELKTVVLIGGGAAAAVAVAVLRRPLRELALPALAALVVVVLFSLPLLPRSGGAILGYNEINDSHFHAAAIDWLASGQPSVPAQSSTAEVVQSIENGYPLGAHEVVAAAVPLVPNGVFGAYQPVLAVLVALGAFVAWWALRASGVPPALAAVGGVLATGGYLQYGYYAEALLPQMAVTPLVFGGIGLGLQAVATRRPAPAALAVAVGVAAILTYSLGVLAYVGPAAAALLVAAIVRSERRGRLVVGLAAAAAAVALVAVVALRPFVRQSVDYIRDASDVFAAVGPSNLPAPADRRLIWGSWVGPDFRFPYERTRVTEVGLALAVALALVGLAWLAARRSPPLLLLLGSAVVGYALIRHNASIYWIAKSYQMVAFPLACVIVAGAAALVTREAGRLARAGRVVAVLALGGYSVAVWQSLAEARGGTAYSNPELHEAGAFRDAGTQGLGLGTVYDDLVKTELPTLDVTWNVTFSVRDSGVVPARDMGWHVVDVDMLQPDRLAGRDYVVEPRVAGLSYPGPPFALAATTDSYRLWRRPRSPEPAATRLPVEPPGTSGGVLLQPGEAMDVGQTGWAGVRIGVRPQEGVLLRQADVDATGSMWAPWADDTTYWASTEGTTAPARASVELPLAGRYRVVLVGATAPGFRLVVDGGTELTADVPTYRGNRDGIRYLGSVELAAGRHGLELFGSSEPGVTRDSSFFQALSLELETPPAPAPACVDGRRLQAAWDRPLEVPASAAGTARLENCGQAPLLVDWVEPLDPPPG